MRGEITKTPDRVSVSISRRIGLPGYSNHYEIFLSYGSDVAEGEGLDQGFKRVEKKVVSEFNRVEEWLENKKIKGGKND